MSDYHQEMILAMELNRSHIGKLVQIITETWSLTGTLNRVDQHDNREWSIDYANGRGLVPSGGEIYAELWIGPWRGEVIGNQPVTVETVRGTLEAPERARLKPTKSGVVVNEGLAMALTEFPGAPSAEEIQEARDIVRGSVVEWGADEEDLPPEPPAEWLKR